MQLVLQFPPSYSWSVILISVLILTYFSIYSNSILDTDSHSFSLQCQQNRWTHMHNVIQIRHLQQTWNSVIGSPGQWVIWVIFYVWVTGSLFWPGVRPEFFRVLTKMPKMQNERLKCWNGKSHCQVSVVGLKSLDVSPCNELYFYLWLLKILWPKNTSSWRQWHKSTFGVHYRTGSPGQLGLQVAGFPGNWVAGSQNVTQFHLWSPLAAHNLFIQTNTTIKTTNQAKQYE